MAGELNIEAFVIHLKSSKKRHQHVEVLSTQLPLPVNIIDATDGLRLSEGEIADAYAAHLHDPRYPFLLRPQEIGCFLSHRKAWQTILDRNLDAGLVVEDDVLIDRPSFDEALELAVSKFTPWDFVRFPKKARGDSGKVIARSSNISLIECRHPGLGMQAQLIGREAARELLEKTERFDRPVDAFIQTNWLHAARILCTRPVVVREIGDDLGGSTVQGNRRSLRASLVRSFYRSRYRCSTKVRNLFFSPLA